MPRKRGAASVEGAQEEAESGKHRGQKREWITGTNDYPIRTDGGLMGTPVFHPTEEEFADFYSYVQKLDRYLVVLLANAVSILVTDNHNSGADWWLMWACARSFLPQGGEPGTTTPIPLTAAGKGLTMSL